MLSVVVGAYDATGTYILLIALLAENEDDTAAHIASGSIQLTSVEGIFHQLGVKFRRYI